jgi:hypothetical protein
MNVGLTKISHNGKTGPIPVSTSSKKTCPNSCPLKSGGCYAEGGPLNVHWLKVSNGERGFSFGEFCLSVKGLPKKQLWRHNQAGDLQGVNNQIDGKALQALTKANKGRRGFTYTHKPVLAEDVKDENLSTKEKQVLALTNQAKIKSANDGGFTVNLSGNSIAHADKLKSLNIAPVVAIGPSDQSTNAISAQGNKGVVCPATVRDDVTCASCGLCQKSERSCVVVFPAHGNSKKKIDQKLLNSEI